MRITRPLCLSELAAAAEDVVVASEWHSQPYRFHSQFGRVASTGAVLFRKSATRLVELWRNHMPRSVDDKRCARAIATEGSLTLQHTHTHTQTTAVLPSLHFSPCTPATTLSYSLFMCHGSRCDMCRHASDQQHFNEKLLACAFKWRQGVDDATAYKPPPHFSKTFAQMSRAERTASPVGTFNVDGRTLQIRFLSFERWPRHNASRHAGKSYAASAAAALVSGSEERCLSL